MYVLHDVVLEWTQGVEKKSSTEVVQRIKNMGTSSVVHHVRMEEA